MFDRIRKIALPILGITFFCNILLLLSDYKVLVSETLLGELDYYPEVVKRDYRGQTLSKTLVCTYFTGRKLAYVVFYYSPNNFLGKSACPFVFKE